MKFLLSTFLISLLMVSGCSSKESLDELKKENKKLKQEYTKIVDSNRMLKQENTRLMEVNVELKNKQMANVDDLPYPISITVPGNATPDLNKVARELFDDYLNYYKRYSGNPQPLKNYTIDKLNIERKDTSSFVFFVEFSVHPENSDAWLAGNGILSADGWIHNKTYFVKVGIKDHTYAMESHGTSP